MSLLCRIGLHDWMVGPHDALQCRTWRTCLGCHRQETRSDWDGAPWIPWVQPKDDPYDLACKILALPLPDGEPERGEEIWRRAGEIEKLLARSLKEEP